MNKNIVIYSVIAFTVYSVTESTDEPKVTPPMTEEQIGTKFYLFTKNNDQKEDLLIKGNTQSISNSHFDGGKDTKFVVHGFLESKDKIKWMFTMKDEYLSAYDINFIIVDWTGGNGAQGNLDYGLAAANTKIVGQVIAALITDLQTVSSIALKSVHIIGHSLGAQIGGFAGKALNGQMGRISGLDPAGPNFDGKTPDERLDPTDALFVDVVHTNALPLLPDLGYGTSEISGHLDFYPNGGKRQPGCPILLDLLFCSHTRVRDLYIESINPSHTKGVGYQASDYESFLRGDSTDCGLNGDKCAFFGEDAIKSINVKTLTQGKKYYFKTDSNSPFLVPEYAIKLKISSKQTTKVNGLLTITLHGTGGDLTFVVNNSEFSSGNTYTYIELSKTLLGDITSVSLKWRKILPLTPASLYVDSIQAIPLSSENVSNPFLHSQEVKTFCSSNPSQGILPEVNTDFTTLCN